MYNILQRFGMSFNQTNSPKRIRITQNSAFLCLPVEIIILICEMVEHTPTLKSLCLVCIRCNEAAERVIFQIIHFRDHQTGDKSNTFKDQMQVFERRPYLRLVVQEVRICALSGHVRELYSNFIAVLERAAAIESFVNLQSIVFFDMRQNQWRNQELAAYLCVLPKLYRLENVEFDCTSTLWGYYDPQSTNKLLKFIERKHPDIFTEIKSLGRPYVPLKSNALRTVYPSLTGFSMESCLIRIPSSNSLRRLKISHDRCNEESLLVTLRGILALPSLEVLDLEMDNNAYTYLARCVEVVQFEVTKERSTLKELYLGSHSTNAYYNGWKSLASVNSVASLLKLTIGASSLRKIEIRGLSQAAYKVIPLITRTSRKTIQVVHLPSLTLSSDSLRKMLSECLVLSELSFRLTSKSEKCLHEILQITNSLQLLEFVVPPELDCTIDKSIAESLFSQTCKSLKEMRKHVGHWNTTIWTVNWVRDEESEDYIKIIDERIDDSPKRH